MSIKIQLTRGLTVLSRDGEEYEATEDELFELLKSHRAKTKSATPEPRDVDYLLALSVLQMFQTILGNIGESPVRYMMTHVWAVMDGYDRHVKPESGIRAKLYDLLEQTPRWNIVSLKVVIEYETEHNRKNLDELTLADFVMELWCKLEEISGEKHELYSVMREELKQEYHKS